jgi:hypothetical protein
VRFSAFRIWSGQFASHPVAYPEPGRWIVTFLVAVWTERGHAAYSPPSVTNADARIWRVGVRSVIKLGDFVYFVAVIAKIVGTLRSAIAFNRMKPIRKAA